jgi:hypothetical protein
MLGLSGLVVVRKIEPMPKNLRHAAINSWMEYTSSRYSKKNHDSFPQFVFLSPSKIKMNEELRVGE